MYAPWEGSECGIGPDPLGERGRLERRDSRGSAAFPVRYFTRGRVWLSGNAGRKETPALSRGKRAKITPGARVPAARKFPVE